MNLLIDNHLPPELAIFMRSRGHDCTHVGDIGLDDASDLEVWTRAVQDKCIVVSKDDDFVALANRPGDTGQLIWVRLGNCQKTALIMAFERVHDELVQAFHNGHRIVEVR